MPSELYVSREVKVFCWTICTRVLLKSTRKQPTKCRASFRAAYFRLRICPLLISIV